MIIIDSGDCDLGMRHQYQTGGGPGMRPVSDSGGPGMRPVSDSGDLGMRPVSDSGGPGMRHQYQTVVIRE